MKLLLDESLPRQLADHFPDEFESHTVQRMGWAGSKNLLHFAYSSIMGIPWKFHEPKPFIDVKPLVFINNIALTIPRRKR